MNSNFYVNIQDVSGRIKVRLTLNSIFQQSRNKLKYGTDLLYAGLLRKIVHKAHEDYTGKVSVDVDIDYMPALFDT